LRLLPTPVKIGGRAAVPEIEVVAELVQRCVGLHILAADGAIPQPERHHGVPARELGDA
jgi:hypothetical protein